MAQQEPAAIRMPYACPECRKTLYATSASRPQPSMTPAARLIFIGAGAVATVVYGVLVVAFREMLKSPIGNIPGTDLVLYHVPPVWAVSLVALPVALVPGLLVGWLAGRIPRVRRLRCWNCRWSRQYPLNALWTGEPEKTEPPAGPDALAPVVDEADPWEEWTAWAYAEIRLGRPPEEVEKDLIAQGWPRDDVEVMVEKCRREARHGPGAVRAAKSARNRIG